MIIDYVNRIILINYESKIVLSIKIFIIYVELNIRDKIPSAILVLFPFSTTPNKTIYIKIIISLAISLLLKYNLS